MEMIITDNNSHQRAETIENMRVEIIRARESVKSKITALHAEIQAYVKSSIIELSKSSE
jgi:hypothetical protein